MALLPLVAETSETAPQGKGEIEEADWPLITAWAWSDANHFCSRFIGWPQPCGHNPTAERGWNCKGVCVCRVRTLVAAVLDEHFWGLWGQGSGLFWYLGLFTHLGALIVDSASLSPFGSCPSLFGNFLPLLLLLLIKLGQLLAEVPESAM